MVYFARWLISAGYFSRWRLGLQSISSGVPPEKASQHERDNKTTFTRVSIVVYNGLLSASLSAIMQGAVLHGLGYNLVKERLIRRSYGVISAPEFVAGQHPEDRRYVDESGTARCRGVMEWFACKVIAIYNVIHSRGRKCPMAKSWSIHLTSSIPPDYIEIQGLYT